MKKQDVSRRNFVGGAAAALGGLALAPELVAARDAVAGAKGIRRVPGGPPMLRARFDEVDEYDALAHLSSNENPVGPSEKAREAMQYAVKYSMRYGYPDNDVHEKIAASHDVDVVARHADTVLLIDGTIRALGRPGDVLQSDQLDRVYDFPHGHDHPTVPGGPEGG